MTLPNKPILFRIMNCQNTMVNKDEKRLEPLLLERANNRAGHVSLQLESLIIAKKGWGPNKGSDEQAAAGLQGPGGSLNQRYSARELLKALESDES